MKELGKNGLKLLKGLHLIAVSCWIGASVTLLSLYLLKEGTGVGGILFGKMISPSDMLFILLPGAIGCLITGLIYGIFSNWGFFKYNWIIFKWIAAIASMLLGIFFLGPWNPTVTKILGDLGLAAFSAYLYHQKTILFWGVLQCLLLMVTVFVSTFKPWRKREKKSREKALVESEIQPRFHRKWLIASAVGAGVFLATLDGSIVNVSLPTMVAALNTNFAIIQWIVLSYLLTLTTLMLGFGRLGDILGKKQIYLLGFTIFTIASALCGFASNVYFLIGFRIAQAIGAAMIVSLGAAILTESFPPTERGKAMGFIGAVVAVGIVTGPTLGGIIIDLLSWHWIFFVNIPIGIIGIMMVWRFIPNLNPAQRQKFDYFGAIVLFTSLICFLIGLSLGQQFGFSNLLVLILLLAALILMTGFILLELRVQQPMINLSLFKNSLLCVNLFTGFISFIAMGGTIILIPFYLELILGYQTMKVGLLMSAIPIMMGIFSPISGSFSDRLGSRPITLLGLAVLCISYFASSTLSMQTDELGFILRILGIGVGMGLFLSPNNSAIMGAGSKNQLGIISGLMALTRSLGQVVGVSVIGTLWAVRIRTITGNWELKDVTKAPLSAQVQGLQFIFIVVGIMIFAGFCISIYGYILDRKKLNRKKQNASEMTPSTYQGKEMPKTEEKMSKVDELDEIRENFEEFFKLVPDPNQKFWDHYESTYKDGVFDAKTKRLIALCGGIIAGCKGCILGQTDYAIKNGATAQEILEVCSIAMSLGGTLAGSQIAIVVKFLKEKKMLE
ncbi:MAG: DHA2 family efflux MFS transporter permease subunit [Desulfobacteraceae bacterium]|jgi:EmrB/QacA subfamily drug resistance transporter